MGNPEQAATVPKTQAFACQPSLLAQRTPGSPIAPAPPGPAPRQAPRPVPTPGPSPRYLAAKNRPPPGFAPTLGAALEAPEDPLDVAGGERSDLDSGGIRAQLGATSGANILRGPGP